MEWWAILAFLFMISILAGVVYVGANTDKFEEFSFGKPSAVSESYISVIEERILTAGSELEIRQIVEETIDDVFSDPRLQKECDNVVKELEKEKTKAIEWVESGKDLYSYPNQKILEISKEFQLCAMAHQAGYINLN